MTTIATPLRDKAALRPAVKHGIGKVKSRMVDGVPIPGEHHLSVYGELAQPTTSKGGTVIIEPDGRRVLHTKNGIPIEEGNMFEQWAAQISKLEDNELLDQITVVDRRTGKVIAEFRRDGSAGTWKYRKSK